MTPFIKKVLIVLILLGTLLLIAGFFFYNKVSGYANTAHDSGAGKQIFIVHPGQSFGSITRQLEKQSLICCPFFFKLFARIKKADKKLQAGEYLLSAAQTPESILNTLVSGKVKLYKITIPEGFNINEISLLAETNNLCTADDFRQLCHDEAYAATLGIKASSLEGYLFPDTYMFPKGSSCQTIISRMVNRFSEIFNKTWEGRTRALGFSRHEIVTLASIIEKETGDPVERPLISSVFHNRLKKRMRLESDPTVIYGIKNFDGNIKRKHLKMETPYNTYRISGLPVGPIANPGEKALEAALYPAVSDFLFFVSKKDTTHHFSKTISEHNRAVRKYQLRKNN